MPDGSVGSLEIVDRATASRPPRGRRDQGERSDVAGQLVSLVVSPLGVVDGVKPRLAAGGGREQIVSDEDVVTQVERALDEKYQQFRTPSTAMPEDTRKHYAQELWDLYERGELTHFLPARVETSRGEPEVTVLPWQGSGDVVAMVQSNAFLIVSPEKVDWEAGEMALVLPRRGLL